MRTTVTALTLAVSIIVMATFTRAGEETTSVSGPVYGAKNALKRPENVESWIFLGSTMGMTYSDESPDPSNPGLFSTVFMEPSSYDAFVKTGRFVDGTVFAKVVRETVSSDGGFSMGRQLGIEVHVKDRVRFPKHGFNFYFFPADDNEFAAAMPEDNGCVSCHQTRAAFDNVFTQFYPTLTDKTPDRWY